jgi:hypothetical protein
VRKLHNLYLFQIFSNNCLIVWRSIGMHQPDTTVINCWFVGVEVFL